MNWPARLPLRPEDGYLSPWLSIATRGLSDESTARVREEITAHFLDAVDGGRRAGLSEDAAGKWAIESLGDPTTARRAFRRTYLSKRQQAVLDQYGKPSRVVSAGFVLLTSIVIWQSVLIEPRWSEPEWPLRIAAALGMAASLVVLTLLNPRMYRRGSHRKAFVAGIVANLLWWSCLLIAVTGQITAAWWLPLAAAATIAYNTPLVRKLRNHPLQAA